METSEALDVISELHRGARARGLYFQEAADQPIRDRVVQVGETPLISFSSCSYLGLEHHPRLIEGVHQAVDRYGTQFSTSRGYLAAPAYAELEGLLSELFGGHALAVSSTSVGHQVALTVLATERDAIVMDHQVHYSVQVAANLARAGGARVEIVRHGELEQAIDLVGKLARKYKTVWFCTDGVFSMYGDLAPLDTLRQILAAAPNVRLYVDDAHGMSWAGTHGRGSFLSRMPLDPRMVFATSLNKAFAAGGGCLVFADAAERDRVLLSGGPLVFSGPLQPPMLGAAVASARVHLSPEITELQARLARRTALTNRALLEARLPLLVENDSPIFFLRLGLPKLPCAVAERMRADGFFVNVSMYPSVPMKRAGIRFSITAAHTPEQIQAAVDALAVHIPAVLAEAGISQEQLAADFAGAIPAESLGPVRRGPRPVSVTFEETLTVETFDSIRELKEREWNSMLGTVGACSWAALDLAERTFRDQPRQEDNWTYKYVVVRRPDGRPVAATFYTVSLIKDDMLMRDEVSRAVELRRVDDPYFLTSTAVGMGSGFSEGNHLYLDRTGPWRDALSRVLTVMSADHERSGAGLLLLRDLPADDPEMDQFLGEQGLVKVPMFDSHYLDIEWKDLEGFFAHLSRRARRQLREVADGSDRYIRTVHPRGSTNATAEHLYRLYRNVSDRKRKLNVFPLPESVVGAMLSSKAWEVVSYQLKPEAGGPADGAPVAWFAAHVHNGHYAPFLCGLDYRYVYSHGAYRNMLVDMVRRAGELGIRQIHMGMDADTEKSRLGTRVVRNAVYVQARDHFQAGILRQVVAEVGYFPEDEALLRGAA